MTLSVHQFDAFHEGVHGRPAFAWQSRLLRQVMEKRRWPRVLDLPTGAGKTTCIDIALFALALDAENPPAAQWCPRRIAMVVDRRIVVDQVAERGRKLLRALVANGHNSIVGDVARRLRGLCRQSDEPVGVFTLRGGMPKDDGWARRPDQPMILASTVDQLGSRLLIHGYGVSRGMKPVQAGLLANDTLVLLDEVHLSQPFAETLDALERLRTHLAARRDSGDVVGLPRRFQHAFLSATPGQSSSVAFALTEDEKAPDTPLGPRLHTRKPAKLLKVEDRKSLCSRCAEFACDKIGRHDVVAVVVNRVASAREVVDTLRTKLGYSAQVVLLTGRMRPLDRDDVLLELRPRVLAGRDRSNAGRKLVVVGTQCIEAGADFDFDALVTESASLDALRQRFGRVDRLGEYSKSESLIVHVDVKDAKEDPIYGTAAAATFKWLLSLARKSKAKTVDFGSMALPSPAPSSESEFIAPRKSAPTLLPAYMDLWMQTSPTPSVVPDIALWLHGSESGPADVQVVWRCDLTEAHLDSGHEDSALAIVSAVRPSSLEAVSVPFVTARKWLAGTGADLVDVADVEIGSPDVDRRVELPNGFRALRWDGGDSEVIEAKDLRPGDAIVVPATRGGLREKTFDPAAQDRVEDLAERAAFFARGQPLLRLHPDVLTACGLSISTDLDEARSALSRLANVAPPGWRKLWLQRLAGRSRSIVVDAEDPWSVLQGRRVSPRELRDAVSADVGRYDTTPNDIATVEGGVELTTDEDDSFCAGRAVALSVHSSDVERFAREYAQHLGLPSAVVEDLALAGWLHDIGKADRRFQIMLRGGSEIDFLADETPLAKSAIPTGATGALQAARSRSGYPKGVRHEVQSLAMLENVRDAVSAKAHDADLVLHLVASHHGNCRPFAPAVEDPHPVDVALPHHASESFGKLEFGHVTSDNGLYKLDSPLADRFWSLVGRYGWLELCWLEAVLRLADHRASEMEQHRTEGDDA